MQSLLKGAQLALEPSSPSPSPAQSSPAGGGLGLPRQSMYAWPDGSLRRVPPSFRIGKKSSIGEGWNLWCIGEKLRSGEIIPPYRFIDSRRDIDAKCRRPLSEWRKVYSGVERYLIAKGLLVGEGTKLPDIPPSRVRELWQAALPMVKYVFLTRGGKRKRRGEDLSVITVASKLQVKGTDPFSACPDDDTLDQYVDN